MSDGERAEVNVLALYCFYGSQSKAEFKGCLTHVSPEHILRLAARYAPTPAAEFAVGTRADCGYTSGPMCSQAHRVVREAEAQYP